MVYILLSNNIVTGYKVLLLLQVSATECCPLGEVPLSIINSPSFAQVPVTSLFCGCFINASKSTLHTSCCKPLEEVQFNNNHPPTYLTGMGYKTRLEWPLNRKISMIFIIGSWSSSEIVLYNTFYSVNLILIFF